VATVHGQEASVALERPQAQLARLRALWDLALADDTSQTQIDGVLQEALAALHCDYVEVWNGTRARIAYAGDEAPTRLIGPSALSRDAADKPTMFFRDPKQSGPVQDLLRSLGWAAVLICPFQSTESRSILSFAWRNPRQTFVSEAELQYVDFLAHVVSRLIELADKQRRINDRMLIDSLTGLHNRAATLDHVSLMLSQANRTGTQLAVLYIDLDGFKTINDSYGHAFGDKTLAEAATRMRSALRRHEIAGRIGGDEFAVLVNFNDETEIEAIAQRLLSKIAAPMIFDAIEVRLRASLGIAMFPRDGTSAEELLAHADAAMYMAKRRKGTGYAFYESGRYEEMPAAPVSPQIESIRHVEERAAEGPVAEERIAEERVAEERATEVRGAEEPVCEGERSFILCFQPIVDARTGRPIAAEALIRWLHPTYGLLPPSRHTDNGTEGVPEYTDRAVMDVLLESDQYRDMYRSLPIHVNISEAAEELLSAHPASKANIALEISEAVVAQYPDRYAEFIRQIRERGFGVGITSFGSVGLPLPYLAELQLDFVKIGPKLIPGKIFGAGSSAAAKAAIKQAHHFGWPVIAENVEDEAQREWLLAAGADALQGYYVCSPLTQRDFSNWLRYRAAQ
jgi:diguanylate cyclase (GGDEF)-like protein